jgi:hypothetical protein
LLKETELERRFSAVAWDWINKKLAKCTDFPFWPPVFVTFSFEKSSNGV